MFDNLRKKITGFFKKPEVKEPDNKEIQKSPDLIDQKIGNDKIENSIPSILISKKKKKIKTIEEEIEKKVEVIKKEENIDIEETTNEKEGKKGFFSKVLNKITTTSLSKDDFNEFFAEFEIILLENNVALEAVDKIKEALSENLIGKSLKKKKEAEKLILDSLKDSILSVLQDPPNLIEKIKKSPEPFVIIFFGINGSGKTTSIAKLAHKLKENNISSVMAAGDTFRAAAIEQLSEHAEKLNIPIIKQKYQTDPAAVAFDAKKFAKANNIKAVLIDTAGRMYTKTNLLKEMEKIIRVSEPNLKIFVGESITGNDATEQAKTFNDSVGIDGIILSKADIDKKAGTILSVSHVTGKPIYFLGTGQEYKDLEPFTKKNVLKNLGLE